MSGGTLGATREPAGARTHTVRAPRWSAAAWGAIAVAALFVALSWWWLATDRAVPFGGGASHLYASLLYRDFIAEGHPIRAITYDTYYPPGIRLFGVLVLALLGKGPDGPVLAQNVVFVPLLAFACYRIGKLVAGPRAGLLAVVFALGTPLIAEQFHVFMLDAPQAALVALATWLILASDRFARPGPTALAGLTVGLGVLTKQLMPLYLVGVLGAVLLRGEGWRNWRGVAMFVGVSLLVGLPWYLVHLDEWGRFFGAAGTGSSTEPVPPAASPPIVSLANLGWYGWATLNGLLFAPLFAFAAIGVVAALARAVRTRPLPSHDPTAELLWGLGGVWLALTLLRHHDVRYTMGAIAFVAVLGTAWIVRLRPRWQALATALLVAAVVVAQLGATFGVGRDPGQLPLSNGAIGEGEGVPPRDRVVVYSSLDYLVSGPLHDGDVLGLMRRLHADGVDRVATEDRGDVNDHMFETIGLIVFARAAGLSFDAVDPPHGGETVAHLIRASALDGSDPCTHLFSGTGVWVEIDGRVSCPS
ncbi:MAG TPA: glycosyltransferase family 39 protein [Conexibacter sp.]|nr:glycosyltransferase family 39 protein [Conexibacter sp.]